MQLQLVIGNQVMQATSWTLSDEEVKSGVVHVTNGTCEEAAEADRRVCRREGSEAGRGQCEHRAEENERQCEATVDNCEDQVLAQEETCEATWSSTVPACDSAEDACDRAANAAAEICREQAVVIH